VPQQGERRERAPRTPNERDESADSQAASEPAHAHGRNAHDALAQGQMDTGKGPVMDAVYDKVLDGASPPVKQARS
jgi:hypothetical protein